MTGDPTVLIIDDEAQIRRLLRMGLEANGYRVYLAATGNEGLTIAAALLPDVVILDLGLPDMDGLEALKRLREWCHAPVVVLSVRDAEEDKIALLDAGADDYLTKPFSTGELLARLRVAQRHAQPAAESAVFTSGRLEVDLQRRLVSVDGQAVKLSVTEYALLRELVQQAGKVLTHHQLLRAVWGPEYETETQYLRVYIAMLRRKIEVDKANPELILTEPGVGYRLAMKM
ncbi:MAG TPA: response regulator [Anaerolineae bacterium]|jgi:two-component system KDP operon response regulator KdpE